MQEIYRSYDKLDAEHPITPKPPFRGLSLCAEIGEKER